MDDKSTFPIDPGSWGISTPFSLVLTSRSEWEPRGKVEVVEPGNVVCGFADLRELVQAGLRRIVDWHVPRKRARDLDFRVLYTVRMVRVCDLDDLRRGRGVCELLLLAKGRIW